jgi:hypothetical protein
MLKPSLTNSKIKAISIQNPIIKQKNPITINKQFNKLHKKHG